MVILGVIILMLLVAIVRLEGRVDELEEKLSEPPTQGLPIVTTGDGISFDKGEG